MRRLLHWTCLAATLILAAAPARAGLLVTFDVSAQLTDPTSEATDTVGGTITIDTTTGIATAADLTVTGDDQFTAGYIGYQDSTPIGVDLGFQPGAGQLDPSVELYLPAPSLVGYGGGPLFRGVYLCHREGG
jgi:hypothetical protein